ncbi:MAG: ATPase [Planctomycetaceae bacterium]|nr:ATPase [Planctomycetaceae bacterium]
MIQPIDPKVLDESPEQSAKATDESATQEPNDLFRELFNTSPVLTAHSPGAQKLKASEERSLPRPQSSWKAPGSSDETWKQFTPLRPETLRAAGLTRGQLSDLLIKQLYLSGSLTGYALAGHARLPFTVIDEALEFLKDEKCVEVASGEMLGRISYRFLLTDLGRQRAREAFEQCRYVGPAPVPLNQYIEQVRKQTVAGIPCTPTALAEAFHDFIIRPGLLAELGPAVCSGKSIFIFGPPGNGKTLIAKGLGNFLNTRGGEIYVPYAIQAENSIVTLFDPTLHQTTDDEELRRANVSDRDESDEETIEQADMIDLRWRRIRRPVVVTGGELTLEMLDLRYNQVSNFYNAPLHIKANGGVFLIDDFGRQIVSPRDLLNRWILPLEERVDFLTLATGKKFSVPFEQLIIFSTNLDPAELVDQAFLRRIRHKIPIGAPDREIFTRIFELCCRQRNIPFDTAAVDYLYANHYDQQRLPRSSDPRDLLDIVQSICRFNENPVVLTNELLADATARFFCDVEDLTTLASAH